MHILFDIGATKTRIAVLRADKDNFELPVVYHTPASYQDGMKVLREHIVSLADGSAVDSIVGGIAGRWDNEFGTIKNSGNLADWDDKPIAEDLAGGEHTPLYIDNDAAMAGLGEAIFGAGKDMTRMLYMTVSSGVGGAIIEQGEITERLEPRHIVVTEEGDTLEQVISGRSIERKYGKSPKDIMDTVFWDHEAKTLAKGLAHILNEHEVDGIVIGGSIMSDVGISIGVTKEYLAQMMANPPIVAHSALGDFGGLYGALALTKKNSYNSAL